MPSLREIFNAVDIQGVDVPEDVHCRDVAMHSERAGPGVLFWASPSSHYSLDTLTTIAWQKGSNVVLAWGAQPSVRINPENPKQFCVQYPIHASVLPLLSAYFYPKRPVFTCAVTGTNGKTSTVWFLSQLWGAQEVSWTTMGTLGTRSSSAEDLPHSEINTPDHLTLAAALHYSALNNIDRFAFEASSHGLDQGRIPLDAVNVGVWTSFSQDHLDYHETMKAYWTAKSRLASLCQQAFLVHKDIPEVHALTSCMRPDAKVLTYGLGMEEDTWAAYDIVTCTESSTEVKLRIDHHTWQGTLPWVGNFQCENFLAALGVFYLSKGDLAHIFSALEKGACFPPPGRLEWVGERAGATIYVDYAHTPDGLHRVLSALRMLSPRRIGLVFGCGGNRDALKRPVMGRIAQESADWVILTSDNPRFEDPHTILKDIQTGCPDAQCIVNRAEAISAALKKLYKGDILLVAGKGHEDVQWTAEGAVSFQDKVYIQSVLAQL